MARCSGLAALDPLIHSGLEQQPQSTFGYLASHLDQFPLAYLHIIEPRVEGSDENLAASQVRRLEPVDANGSQRGESQLVVSLDQSIQVE